MSDNNKTEEFLEKLAPCIERGELEACVEEAARLAGEMGIGAEELLDLATERWNSGNHAFAYVLALAAAHGLEGNGKAQAYFNAGLAAQFLRKVENAEKHYQDAIAANPKHAAAHSNYAILLQELNRKDEAEEHYKVAIDANPRFAEVHHNYANLLSELKRNEEAEEHYKVAIDANPRLAQAHSNYANLLKELDREGEAEEHYKLAIDANPRLAQAHSNYANLLKELDREGEAEEHYKLAIDANPKLATVHHSYAILLSELDRKTEAEEQYKLAIEFDPKLAVAHYNYAILLLELDRKSEVEEQYKLAIEFDPKDAGSHSNYAILLSELNRKEEAQEQYLEAIKANPNYANAHGAYGLLLIELDRRNDAWKETEKASNIFKETGNITQSYLAKAWFYERYSEKNFNWKKFRESGEDAEKAGDEYLNASETTEGDLKDDLALQGNVLKAKSFVRKIPEKSWYRKILNRFGKNPDISELMDNLSEAAKYYEKASCCSAGERKDICNACFSSISVFSEILLAMGALIKDDDAEIDKDKWLSSLELAHKIYNEKKLNNGAALVDTLKQLIKCVDELAEHRKVGLHIQEEKLGKCYNSLIEVSEKLDGALKIISEHAVDAIREYAKKQGMGFIEETKPKQSFFDNWIVKAGVVLGIIASIILLLQFLKLDSSALDLIKSLISRIGIT